MCDVVRGVRSTEREAVCCITVSVRALRNTAICTQSEFL